MSNTFLGRFVIAARRRPWMTRLKNFLPDSWKKYAWEFARGEDEIEVAGNRMRIPIAHRNALYISDQYEPEVLAKLRELLRPGMTFCDVGANMGVFTLLAARLVGPTGRVFSFEPFPQNAAVLRENVALNGFQNVTVVEAAVAEQNSEALLHLSESCGTHSLSGSPLTPLGTTLLVRTIRLDSVPGLDHIDIMKSDTEGTEVAVLRSLGPLKPAYVIVEAHTEAFKGMANPSPDHTGPGFLRGLAAAGFTVVENLSDPAAGVRPLEEDVAGCWNLLLRPV